jgi:uncharacterized glyoxalase superfamily protein PhnB
MLGVPDAPTAAQWYKEALGAEELWSLGPVCGLEIEGAAFFLAQPDNNGWADPRSVGTTTARIEVFCDDPDGFVDRAMAKGASGNHPHNMKDHPRPWGTHRQGGFTDPFGHIWLVGDRSPLKRLDRSHL